MKVLVTGNLGYIGTVLAPVLLQRGHEVRGLDSDLYRRCTFGRAPTPVRTTVKDVRDAELGDVTGFDAVIHLAALSNDPLGYIDPDLTHEINCKASVRLAELCKAAGVRRFIFSSSCSNYGAGGEEMLTEDSPFRPVTPYGESKVLTEQQVAPMADESFSPIFLRNATAYGMSPRLRFDLVVNNLVAWAYTTGNVFLKSDGTAWRPIVHVEDISLAFAAVLEAPRELVHNKAYNVGRTEENYRVVELARIAKDAVPGSRLKVSSEASADKRCYRVNCDLIVNTVEGFRPRWTAAAGARQLLDAYRAHGVTLEEFEGPRYQRTAHIRALLSEGVLDRSLRFVMQPA